MRVTAGSREASQFFEAILCCVLLLFWCHVAHEFVGASDSSISCTLLGMFFHGITLSAFKSLWKQPVGYVSVPFSPPPRVRRARNPQIHLPTITYLNKRHGSDEKAPESDVCPICLFDLKEGDNVCIGPSCGHQFHKECIHEWISYSTTACPCCRQDLWPFDPPRLVVE